MQVTDSGMNCYCGADGSERLFDVDKYSVQKCRGCGQVYVLGISRQDSCSEYAESGYFTERNKYLEKREELYAYFQTLLDRIKIYKSQGAFLDVGCSVGILLEAARQNGYKVAGVELSGWASEFARQNGLDVTTGTLTDAAYPERHFDVVVMNHVLEHIPDPVAALAEVRRIMKDDGLFVIGVPNFGSYMARIMRGKWMSLMPDQHYWQFTRASLIALLIRSGFETVYSEARDNHEVVGWRPVKFMQRLVNGVAVVAGKSEAMLLFARKTENE